MKGSTKLNVAVSGKCASAVEEFLADSRMQLTSWELYPCLDVNNSNAIPFAIFRDDVTVINLLGKVGATRSLRTTANGAAAPRCGLREPAGDDRATQVRGRPPCLFSRK